MLFRSHRLAEIGFAGDELDFKTRRQMKRRALLLRRERLRRADEFGKRIARTERERRGESERDEMSEEGLHEVRGDYHGKTREPGTHGVKSDDA